MTKQPHEWEEEDIQRLIDNRIKESTSLDYKRCDSLLERTGQSREKIINELSKDVSSFANAEGGTIVYGIIEEDYFPREIDQGFNPLQIKREWLEDVIDSNVKPKIDGLKIKQIEINNSHPGKVIYVVYIPQSLQGAIQAKDFIYYQRRNFKSEPMEDYQVRDVMNRFKHPLLEPEITYKFIGANPDGSHRYEFNLKIQNRGIVAAKAWGMDMLFPELYFHSIEGSFSGDIWRGESHQKYLSFKFRNNESSDGNDQIFFPEEEKVLFGDNRRKFNYGVNRENSLQLFILEIHITVYADDMPPRRLVVPFHNYQRF